jgi:hypothetical protein
MKNFKSIFRFCLSGKSIIPFVLLLLLYGSIQGLYPQSRGDDYSVPVKLNDGWEVASLREVGINPGKIEQITREIRNDDKFDGIHSMLIVKDGKLVHEAYFWGHQRNSLHVMASITKSVTSTLIGIAIDKGFKYIGNSFLALARIPHDFP